MSMDGIIPYVLGGGGGGGGSSAATVAAMISGTEDTATASQGYSVGEYFIYNDALYIVTSPISQGDTITPGTNCDTTTVCENLTDLNGAITTVESGLAIPQTGNTCTLSGGIPKSAFVYLTGHSTLSDGFYKNKSGTTIAQNSTFTSNNLLKLESQTGVLNYLNAALGYVNYVYINESLTVQNGTPSAPTENYLDLSNRIPSGALLIGAILTFGKYNIPYVENGVVLTWVDQVFRNGEHENNLLIKNATTGWGTVNVLGVVAYSVF